MISKTSKEGQNKVSRNLENNNNIFNSYPYYNTEKNHFKKSNNYEMGTTTQITTLPGCVKRNMYEINDDMYFKKPFNESRMYKMIHDFNADLNYKDNYNPITQGYNVNEFPKQQRYYGSYRKDVNDHESDALELAKLVKGLNCYINLIPYNETNNIDFKRTNTVQIMRFYDILKKNSVNVTIRKEFGSKISAACGQLRSKKEEL